MASFINAIQKVDRALARFESWLIVGVVIVMLLMTTAQVVLKILGYPMIQLEEMARFLVIWVGFAGGAVAAYQSRHINIDIVTRFLKGWPKRICLSIVWLIGVAITSVLLKTAISYVFTSDHSLLHENDIAISFGTPGDAVNVPGWLAAVIMPVGLALIALHLLFGAIYAAAGVMGPGHTAQDLPTQSDGQAVDVTPTDSMPLATAGIGDSGNGGAA